MDLGEQRIWHIYGSDSSVWNCSVIELEGTVGRIEFNK